MSVQGRILKFCNIWGSYRNVLGNTSWQNFPNYQQIAGVRQSLEEKYNIPPKPKRPLTPYFKFMAQIRPELKRANPQAKVTDLVRETAVRWEKIDPQLKLKLETEYKKEQAVYAKQRLDYDTNLTEEQKDAMKLVQVERYESKEKRKHKQKCKDNNKPKKPCSAFVLYMKTLLPSRDGKNFRIFQKEVADKWQNLSETQKKPFLDEMHAQMKDYQKNMVEWERKMIKMGNTDIVRQDALLEPKKTKPKTKKTE